MAGDVNAGSIEVEGQVKGNLNASGKVRLAHTARLEGDLHTARLEVTEGAVFVGRCVVGPNGSAKPPQDKVLKPPAKEREGVPMPAAKK